MPNFLFAQEVRIQGSALSDSDDLPVHPAQAFEARLFFVYGIQSVLGYDKKCRAFALSSTALHGCSASLILRGLRGVGHACGVHEKSNVPRRYLLVAD